MCQHHPLRSVAGVEERLDDFKTLDNRFSFRFGFGRRDILFELSKHLYEIQVGQQLTNNFATHAGIEFTVAESLYNLLILLFIEHIELGKRIQPLAVIARFTGIFDNIGFIVEDTFEVFHLDAQQRTDTGWQ